MLVGACYPMMCRSTASGDVWTRDTGPIWMRKGGANPAVMMVKPVFYRNFDIIWDHFSRIKLITDPHWTHTRRVMFYSKKN